MIRLTRMDGQEIALNCDHIVWLEARPDTTVRLLAGETLLVRERLDEVCARIADWRARILREAGLPGRIDAAAVGAPPSALPAAHVEESARTRAETCA